MKLTLQEIEKMETAEEDDAIIVNAEIDKDFDNFLNTRHIFFIDIDGVLSCRNTYEQRISDYNNPEYKEILKETRDVEKIKAFNEMKEFIWGKFANEVTHGEIYDKGICKSLSRTIKQYFTNNQIVLISNGCIIFSKPTKLDLPYWSKTMFDNIPIVDQFTGIGDLKWRYMKCMDWLMDNIKEGELFEAYILDDLKTDTLIDKDEKGIVHINHRDGIMNFTRRFFQTEPLTHENINHQWYKYNK